MGTHSSNCLPFIGLFSVGIRQVTGSPKSGEYGDWLLIGYLSKKLIK